MKEHESKDFRYVFTMKELMYFLFGGNKCPKCGQQMQREKGYTIRTDLFQNSGRDPIYAPGSKVKQYYYKYKCQHCEKEYSLNELANKNK